LGNIHFDDSEGRILRSESQAVRVNLAQDRVERRALVLGAFNHRDLLTVLGLLCIMQSARCQLG
jgi:hypothetical protein